MTDYNQFVDLIRMKIDFIMSSLHDCYISNSTSNWRWAERNMGWLSFIASIISSLAWPVAVVSLVVLLKDELMAVVPFIKTLRAGPVEAEFEREVQELQNSTAETTESVGTETKDGESAEFLFQLAEFHPRSAILESWVRLEAAARAAIVKEMPAKANERYITAARLSDSLIQAELLNKRQVQLYHELRRLRNEIAHGVGFEPTEKSACAYVDMATGLQLTLRGESNA